MLTQQVLKIFECITLIGHCIGDTTRLTFIPITRSQINIAPFWENVISIFTNLSKGSKHVKMATIEMSHRSSNWS
jgi:hypothetical protein